MASQDDTKAAVIRQMFQMIGRTPEFVRDFMQHSAIFRHIIDRDPTISSEQAWAEMQAHAARILDSGFPAAGRPHSPRPQPGPYRGQAGNASS